MSDKKIAVLTGGTDGIGKETALGLAQAGLNVYIVGRNAEKGKAVTAELIEKTKNPDIHFLRADLSIMKEIRALSAEIHEKVPRIDVLINNAGGFFKSRTLTTDGLEYTFAFNHLAYFLLTDLVLDLIKKAGPGARIVNVSSMAHHFASMDFSNLQGEKGYRPWGAYSQSKLANILFTFALSKRLEGTGITVNCLHPGYVRTPFNIAPQNGFMMRLIARLFAISPSEGARTSLYLALDPSVDGKSGAYYADSKPSGAKRDAYDTNLQERLWAVSIDMIETAAKAAPTATI